MQLHDVTPRYGRVIAANMQTVRSYLARPRRRGKRMFQILVRSARNHLSDKATLKLRRHKPWTSRLSGCKNSKPW